MDNKKKNDDIYYTIAHFKRNEIKIKGSRFIATASPAVNKDEAMLILEKIRSEFYSATHNCFAYIIGPDGMEYRSSDDGEPSGSAGKPIMFTLQKFNVMDLIVVVTRYFGGTKLGVGGLSRAYSDAATEVLNLCEIKPVYITIPIKVFCIYEDLSVVKRIISENAVSFEEMYHDSVEIIANVLKSKVNQFIDLITNQTNGRAGSVKMQN
jgi:uncharacterized YigZ family protein